MSSPNFRGTYPADWPRIAHDVKTAAGWKCIRCAEPHCVDTGYVLTVHHFDGDKANCAWWNLLALCQRCHLRFQARVNPHQPYMFEHSAWLKPYVAGFYAVKYEGRQLSRPEVELRLEDLLAHERLA